MRRKTTASLAALLLLAVCRPARAQERAGLFLPLDSRADRALRWAVDAGALPRLDPLMRPWSLADARAALSSVDTAAAAPPVRSAVRWAANALDDFSDSLTLDVEGGLSAYRHAGRDFVREAGERGIGPALGVRGQLATGPWTLVVNPAFNERWRDDPEFTGYRGGPVTGRMIEAYASLGGRAGWLVLGRMARNWGPASLDGLLLSAIAAPGDQLAGSLRFGRLSLTSIAQRLDDRDTLATVPVQRWFLAHRLAIRLGEGSWLALTETGVYGGRGAGFDLAMHAPLNLALLSQFNEGQNLNTLLGADAAVRLPGRARLEASGFLDDIQVNDSALTDHRPTAYGLTIGLAVPVPHTPLHADLRYLRVSSLAYRNSFNPDLIYAVRDVGIGQDAADFDVLRLRLGWKPALELEVFGEVLQLRQGSADFRQPFPSDSVLALPGQGFLVAPVRHATLARVAGVADFRGIGIGGTLGVLRALGGGTTGVASIDIRLRLDALHRRAGIRPALDPVR